MNDLKSCVKLEEESHNLGMLCVHGDSIVAWGHNFFKVVCSYRCTYIAMYVHTQITSIINYYLQLLITSSFYLISLFPKLLMTLWQAWKMRFYGVVGAKQKSMNSVKREKML